jgi:regulator of sirC expression with transglutaminase-like and TPR domain
MKTLLYLLASATIFTASLNGASPEKIKNLYNSLNTRSVSQHLAFYQLYPDSPYGLKSLRNAWELLSPPGKNIAGAGRTIPSVPPATDAIISLVNKLPDADTVILSDHELWAVEELAQQLPNRQLLGHHATSEEEVTALPPEEIDIARGLFLSELGNDEEAMRKIRSYEAMVDLMALQILTRIPITASPELKIREINSFIFQEMGFRFPPQSIYAKDIDLYTFLPSVLDSRRGVCLGVSILYLCLSQRLDLNLEMITPPGHIYVRYRDGDTIINIETTARGVNPDSEMYLGIGTRSLQQRNIKEVIGLAHFNQASVFWNREKYDEALESYQKAKNYLPNDMLLKELMGYMHILKGEDEEGKALLAEVIDYIPDHAISKEPLSYDVFNGNASAEGIKALFMHVDETRESILKKKDALEKELKIHPNFRTGYFALASTWLQLHRTKEALELLNTYHNVYPKDPTAEYYLSILNMERLDYNKAWAHFKQAEALTKARDHHPKALKELRKGLAKCCPD